MKTGIKHLFCENPLIRILVSATILILLLIAEHIIHIEFAPRTRFILYLISFLFVGIPILWEGVKLFSAREYFNEFTLMTLASVGAFIIGEFPEGVAVILLYSIGEYFQDRAVDSAHESIENLINIRPATGRIISAEGEDNIVTPDVIQPGDIIKVLKGERVCVDGILCDESALFDTSSLTGEIEPRKIVNNQEVLSGMILLSESVKIKAIRRANQSEVERILQLVEQANERKSHTEQFIRKFAKIYTPIVVILALSLILISSDLFYRALTLMVISCPCALVISVPLSYFSAIGVASKFGVLFKGGTFLDILAKVKTIFFDKTGTLTGRSEQLKPDALYAIEQLRKLGIKKFVILSGDKEDKVRKIAKEIGATSYYSELLPQDKLTHLNEAAQTGEIVAFVGDGVNDAPVLRGADVGIAMGGLGSDAAIECADIVLQTDQLPRIATAIQIARKTKRIVVQNIILSLSVKFIILTLGILGITSLWGAVFADSGVALLTVVNALRIKILPKYLKLGIDRGCSFR